MRPIDLTLAGTPAEPFWQLLYRYWFWGWLFRDANQGDLLRRAAAWRHNVAQRIHLPVYMRRWMALMGLTFAAALGIEVVLDARAFAALLYVGAVLSAVVEVVASIAWLFLRPRAALRRAIGAAATSTWRREPRTPRPIRRRSVPPPADRSRPGPRATPAAGTAAAACRASP
jgi:hypothetical protein